jgi:hypothetical protein
MYSDDDYEPDDDLYDDDEDEDYDEDLEDEEDEDEDDWDLEDEDEEDEDDVDIEECEYTNTGSCDDCTLPEDKECPYSPEDDDI